MTATLEQATTVTAAEWLRRMADWLDAHPGAEEELMKVEAGRFVPKIVFYNLKALSDAFPGRECSKTVFQNSDVFTLRDDGIQFEAWQKRQPEPQKEEKVTL